MEWWVLELITVAVMFAIIAILGPLIKRYGKSYAADVFRVNPRTGKSYLVLLRAAGGRLLMQQLYHSDEVREVSEVPGSTRQNREAEVKLARQLIDQISEDEFRPGKYEDVVRKRIDKLIQQKLKGKDITEAEPGARPKAEVIDLMEALKASLGRKKAAAARPSLSRRPVARAVAGGRKK